MQILFFGDIYGSAGRAGLKKVLPQKITQYQPDFVIANCENMTHGRGAITKHIEELMDSGVDAFTSGNHVFNYAEGIATVADPRLPIVRPANYPAGVPGRGTLLLEKNGKKLLLGNLMGRVFMGDPLDNPFAISQTILQEAAAQDCRHIFIDFHAEATSEKAALGHYLDGKISALVGTHTHVQTADERVLRGGTAFISDTGFCGPLDSIIGAKKDLALGRFLTGINVKIEPQDDPPYVVSGATITLDDETGKAKSIERIYEVTQ